MAIDVRRQPGSLCLSGTNSTLSLKVPFNWAAVHWLNVRCCDGREAMYSATIVTTTRSFTWLCQVKMSLDTLIFTVTLKF